MQHSVIKQQICDVMKPFGKGLKLIQMINWSIWTQLYKVPAIQNFY